MDILIFYDIVDTRVRNQLIELLLSYSFVRVQYSVFLGKVTKKQFSFLLGYIPEIINLEKDSVYAFPLCEKDFKTCQFIGKIVNKQFYKQDFLVF